MIEKIKKFGKFQLEKLNLVNSILKFGKNSKNYF